jgi:hypothetical protein
MLRSSPAEAASLEAYDRVAERRVYLKRRVEEKLWLKLRVNSQQLEVRRVKKRGGWRSGVDTHTIFLMFKPREIPHSVQNDGSRDGAVFSPGKRRNHRES